MNQSLAMLIKLKLFQGSHPEVSQEEEIQTRDKREKKHRRWGKSRQGRSENKSVPRSSNDGSRSLSQLNSIGEEVNARAREGESDPQTTGRSYGKLRNLKNKMSIHDLTPFKTSASQGTKQTASEREARVATTASGSDQESNHAVDDGMQQRQNFEVAREPVSKVRSSSSVWSTRSLNSPVKAADVGQTSTASSVRFSSNVISGKPRTSSVLHHSRSGSMEIKGSKLRAAVIGRSRSRTVGVSDYADSSRSSIGNGEFMSSIGVHSGRARSSSQTSRSPLISSQNSSHIQFPNIAAVHAAAPPTPPRLSNGSIPFPTAGAPSVAASQPPISRRSSSLVNAFNSFVNLRSSSASSMKGPSVKPLTPKFDVTLDDFPEPPDPIQNESPEEYLQRLGQYGKFIGVILCDKKNDFKLKSLKCFLTHCFNFECDPLDIALRKLLMFVELPKESQQIDRLLTVFSEVYFEVQSTTEEFCPWTNSDQVYFLVFSLLMLHTDFFSPSNRFKMTKPEFVNLVHSDQQSDGCKIPKEILAYYYDNIVAKESPKFDFFSIQQALNSSESGTPENAPGSLNSPVYSPIEIIGASGSMAYQDQIPVAYPSRGRTSSNSYSSYFPHVPISTSSSSASVLQDDIDIYSQILDDSLLEIDMCNEVDKYWDDDCISRPLISTGNRYNKYFSIIKEVKGGYLKIHKDHLARLALPNFEILNEHEDSYRYLKIVQMGEIQQLTVNKKFSIVGAVHKVSWKKVYAILTPAGLLVFDGIYWVNPELVKDERTGTSNYIIKYNTNATMISEYPISCNGLLAIRKEDEMAKAGIHCSDDDSVDTDLPDTPKNCVIHLHGSQKVNVWKCSNKYERDNWIDSINLMAAYDGCYFKPGFLNNSIITMRKHSMKDRISKLQHTMEEKSDKLRELQTVLPLYRQCMPLSYKTRNDLTAHIKQLAVRMDWLVYETKRNEVYLAIIRQVDVNFEQCLKKLPGTEEFESSNNVNSINESFIFNEELIPACHADESSKFDDSLEFDTSNFFQNEYDDAIRL